MKQGRDWHGWAWKDNDPDMQQGGTDGLFFWAEPDRPAEKPSDSGRWIKVRFVEVSKQRKRP